MPTLQLVEPPWKVVQVGCIAWIIASSADRGIPFVLPMSDNSNARGRKGTSKER